MAFIAEKPHVTIVLRDIVVNKSEGGIWWVCTFKKWKNNVNFVYMQFWTGENKGSKANSEQIIHNFGKENTAEDPDEQYSKQFLSGQGDQSVRLKSSSLDKEDRWGGRNKLKWMLLACTGKKK